MSDYLFLTSFSDSRDAFLDQYQEHEDVKLNETVENSKVSEGERHEKV